MTDNRHTFALYLQNLSTFLSTENNVEKRGLLTIFNNKDFYQRISTVLRLKAGDTVIIFDDSNNALCSVNDESFAKKQTVSLSIESLQKNKPLAPSINLYQGLTKKSAFEEIVYNAAQLGVTSIIPVITAKTHKAWFDADSITRLRAIMIAGCEQAKQFNIPTLQLPVSFSAINNVINKECMGLLLDPAGISLVRHVEQNKTSAHGYNLFIGPEGGFTDTESLALLKNGCIQIRLCSSILRSQEAALLAAGIIRSA